METKASKESKAPKASNNNRQFQFFEHLHHQLSNSSASLSAAKNVSSSALPLSAVLIYFSPPQDTEYKGSKANLLRESFCEFLYPFPNCLEILNISAIEVGPIVQERKEATISCAASNLHHFSVTLQFDGTLLSFGFDEQAASSSSSLTSAASRYFFKLMSTQFTMTIDNSEAKFEFVRITKSRNCFVHQLVVTRDNLEVFIAPLKENYLGLVVEEGAPCAYQDLLALGSQAQEALINRFRGDYRSMNIFTATKELIPLVFKLLQFSFDKQESKWLLEAEVQMMDDKSVYLQVNDNKYFVNKVLINRNTIQITARMHEPDIETLRMSIWQKHNGTKTSELTFERHMKKYDTSEEQQELRFDGVQVLGHHNVTSSTSQQVVHVKLPKFIRDHCTVTMTNNVSLDFQLDTWLVNHAESSVDMKLPPRYRFLRIEGLRQYLRHSNTAYLAATLCWKERNSYTGEYFKQELQVLSEMTTDLCKPLHSRERFCVPNIPSIGSLLLDKFDFLRRKKANASAEVLRQYYIYKIASVLDLEQQRLEVRFMITKQVDYHRYNQEELELIRCIVTFDLDRMTVRVVVDNSELGLIELEYGIDIGVSLKDTLWSEKILNHHMSTDITIHFGHESES